MMIQNSTFPHTSRIACLKYQKTVANPNFQSLKNFAGVDGICIHN